VLVGWLLVLVAVVASASAFSGKTSNEFSVPGTESQVAQDLLQEKFPEAGGGTARSASSGSCPMWIPRASP